MRRISGYDNDNNGDDRPTDDDNVEVDFQYHSGYDENVDLEQSSYMPTCTSTHAPTQP